MRHRLKVLWLGGYLAAAGCAFPARPESLPTPHRLEAEVSVARVDPGTHPVPVPISGFQGHRRSDGTLVYEGHAFTATIGRDGTVAFSDAPGFRTNGVSTQDMRIECWDIPQQVQSADPDADERNRFMEETEELRAGLEAAARRERMAMGLRRLGGRLLRIWQDESQSAEQRRRQIFELWEGVEDRGGDGGPREMIETFVRENLPMGTRHQYSADELRSLNAGRAAADRFEPYHL